mmetsp:Transcript_28770/g.81024  ORF Transcript_28770/g.81024 Transcript_28770/m.81024 type:complete len:234 (+) Transcript_28770:210-911(+)
MDKLDSTCAHMGCGQAFCAADNPEGGCRYHPGQPYFHDGMKEWTCCKKKSHDFSEFMDIPGCTMGRHSADRPHSITTKEAARKIAATAASPSSGCSRCDQGFFCADHKEAVKLVAGAISGKDPAASKEKPSTVPAPAIVQPQAKPLPTPTVVRAAPQPDSEGFLTCKHYSCGQKYKQAENHEGACKHHPGPAVFHDRKKGWGCCNKFEKDFDAFLSIAPCSCGQHDASFDAGF